MTVWKDGNRGCEMENLLSRVQNLGLSATKVTILS